VVVKGCRERLTPLERKWKATRNNNIVLPITKKTFISMLKLFKFHGYGDFATFQYRNLSASSQYPTLNENQRAATK
jgi:hypothetical protein